MYNAVGILGSLEDSTKIVMECTGRYHEPMLKALYEAGLFVSVVNFQEQQGFKSWLCQAAQDLISDHDDSAPECP